MQQSGRLVFYFSVYAGLVLFNFLVLLGSLLVFERLIKLVNPRWHHGQLVLYGFLFFLLSNQLVKNFFWSPHQQLLNIFTPLLATYWGMLILRLNAGTKKIFWFALSGGLLLLIYGNAILLLVSLVLAFALKNLKLNKSPGRFILQLAAIVAVFAFPTIAWILVLKSQGITYYNHEVAYYRNFIWIIDGLTKPGLSLGRMATDNFNQFVTTFGGLAFPAAILLLAVSLQKIFPGLRSTRILSRQEGILFAGIFVATLSFYGLLGTGSYADRYTYSLAPYFIVLAAFLLNASELKPFMKWAFILLLIAHHIYILLYNPIHFSNLFYY